MTKITEILVFFSAHDHPLLQIFSRTQFLEVFQRAEEVLERRTLSVALSQNCLVMEGSGYFHKTKNKKNLK